MIIIHIGDENQSGQIVLFAHLPCSLCAGFNAGLAVYNDNGSVCYADSFLCFSHEIKKSGSIQEIDLNRPVFAFIFQRNEGGGNGELPLDLFFVIITDGVAVGHLTHTLCYTCNKCQSLRNGRLTGASVSK